MLTRVLTAVADGADGVGTRACADRRRLRRDRSPVPRPLIARRATTPPARRGTEPRNRGNARRSLTRAARAMGNDPPEALVGRNAAKGRAAPSDADRAQVTDWLDAELDRIDRTRDARSRPRHRAPPESRRIQLHGPRSARRRFPAGRRFSAGRCRLRLRQQRRRAVALHRADGEVPRGCRRRSRAPRSTDRSL